MVILTDKEVKNFKKFTAELGELSKKYGVVLRCTGGVSIGEVASIEYSQDETSGDLYPEVIRWQEDVEVN